MTSIYVRNPYPFTLNERQAIEATISRLYGITMAYMREYPGNKEPVDHLIVQGGSKTTLGYIGLMLKAFHLQAVLREKFERSMLSERLSEDIEIAIDINGNLPSWAKES